MSNTTHISLIDDDLDIQELIVAFFKQKNFKVTCFSDAETALTAFNKPDYHTDVILCDLNLPGINGVEFTEKMKMDKPDIPIILITTNRSSEKAVEAIEKGAYDFIVKPIHFPQLHISVERALKLNHLNKNITTLREQVKTTTNVNAGQIVGKSPKFLAALEIAKRVAKSQANIFITGESGTGKEVFAKYIHNESSHNKGPFIAINCSAIPENLLESELFGHAKGAFTGATDKKVGLFEEAENGTLFLDEIGDLSFTLQAKLLRVLQEKKIKRIGENQFRNINCRILSATHKNLLEAVRKGEFREDLYFRLNVIPINIPPLRERPEDILPLAENFLKKFSALNNSPALFFSKDAVKFMLDNSWRGNVRELVNTIERAVVLTNNKEIPVENFLSFFNDYESANATPNVVVESTDDLFVLPLNGQLLPLEQVVQSYIEFAVKRNNGAKDKTAKEIGIDRKTLYKKFKPQPLATVEH